MPLLLVLSLTACDDDSDLQAQIDALAADLALSNARVAELEAEVTALSEVDLTELTAVVEGNQADLSTLGQAVTDQDARVAAIEADYLVAADIVGLTDDVDLVSRALPMLGSSVAILQSDMASVEADVDTLEGQLSALDADVDTIQELFNYVTVDTSAHTVRFSGANVRIDSGSGSTTGTVNGYGNLIIGYNEDDGLARTGSHNLILGHYNDYQFFGSIVMGWGNDASGQHSTVGGIGNTVSSNYGVVLAGQANASTSAHGVVVTGTFVDASGRYASVLTGHNADAGGTYSSMVSAQDSTIASGYQAYMGVVMGADNASVDHDYSVVTTSDGSSSSAAYELTD